MRDSFETSRGPEAVLEPRRESPERFAERVVQVERGESLARSWRAEGDAELAGSRNEATALLDAIDPVGPVESGRDEENAEERAATALRAVERALRPAARPDLLKVAQELARDAEDGTDAQASLDALLKIAGNPSNVPALSDAKAAREWADKKTEAVNGSAEFDRQADVFLARLRTANKPAADRAEAEYDAYCKHRRKIRPRSEQSHRSKIRPVGQGFSGTTSA